MAFSRAGTAASDPRAAPAARRAPVLRTRIRAVPQL